MKTFEVYASELVFYRIRIEAENEEQAREKVFESDIELGDPRDSADFEIIEVQEITPQGFPV